MDNKPINVDEIMRSLQTEGTFDEYKKYMIYRIEEIHNMQQSLCTACNVRHSEIDKDLAIIKTKMGVIPTIASTITSLISYFAALLTMILRDK